MENYCIIIPAYNAGEHLSSLLIRIAKFAPKEDIIVVDDGSQDETASIAQDWGANLLIHNKNLGKGAALKTGFQKALNDGYDTIITIDADLQHPPELIPKLIAPLEDGFDIAVGNRLWDTSKMPLERKVSNYLSTLATSILAGQRLFDSQCGFRAIKKWVIERANLKCNRYQHESEMLVEAARMGAKIAFIEMPTIYNGNKSYFDPIADTARFILFLISYYPKRWRK